MCGWDEKGATASSNERARGSERGGKRYAVCVRIIGNKTSEGKMLKIFWWVCEIMMVMLQILTYFFDFIKFKT